MVISPILRGMMGLESDQLSRRITFTPHVPDDWRTFSIRALPACGGTIALEFQRAADALSLKVTREGTGECTLDFAPVVTLPSGMNLTRAASANGRSFQPRLVKTLHDMHAKVSVPLPAGATQISIRLIK